MPHMKLILLLVMVITAAGLTIWVGYLAMMQSGALDGHAWGAIVPLLLVVAMALRILLKGRSQ